MSTCFLLAVLIDPSATGGERSDEADPPRRWLFGFSAHKPRNRVVDARCLGYASPSTSTKGGVGMRVSSSQSRRVFLKRTALGAAGTLLAPSIVRAAPKSMTMMHESSFIPPYDAYFKNTLAPAYEKATGIKINYEMVSVGSLQTRVTTAAENRRRPGHVARSYFNWAYPVRREARRRQRHRRRDRQGRRRLARVGAGSGGRQRQMEGDPVRQHRPADELPHRLVQARPAYNEVPRYLGRICWRPASS